MQSPVKRSHLSLHESNVACAMNSCLEAWGRPRRLPSSKQGSHWEGHQQLNVEHAVAFCTQGEVQMKHTSSKSSLKP